MLELACYDVVDPHSNHYTWVTPLMFKILCYVWNYKPFCVCVYLTLKKAVHIWKRWKELNVEYQVDFGDLELVAKRISYFCLARNLFRPLGSTHNFPQSGWLILFLPDYLSGQHKLGKSAKHFLFAELLRSVLTSYCLLFNSSSSIDTMREAV